MPEVNIQLKCNLLFVVADLSSHFDCLPNSNRIAGVLYSEISYPPDKHHSPIRSSTAAPSLCAMPRSPPDRHSSLRILEYNLKKLKFVRPMMTFLQLKENNTILCKMYRNKLSDGWKTKKSGKNKYEQRRV